MEYIAFGEVLFEEHSSSFSSPYLFNGKELDRETNLSYYGARYYDAKTSLWLSVDPLAELAPDKTPYHFVSNNPINRVDPRGLTDYRVNGETTTIDDGKNGVLLDVSQKQLNRLQSKFDKGGKGYERMMNRLSSQNGYTTYGATDDGISITTHKAGGDSYQQHQDKIFGNYSDLSTRRPASGAITSMEFSSPFFPIGGVLNSLGRAVTTAEGFLFGSLTLKTPFNISVQRFGNMSFTRPDFWGLEVGTSSFVNRTFVAIKPEWNALTQYTTGIIPKGTPVQFGIVGPQGLAYPGGSLQFIVNSNSVINQASSVIPR